MRIAIDAREMVGQPTGVGRYLSEIVREWGSLADAGGHDYLFCSTEPLAYGGPLRATMAVRGGSGTVWEQRVLPSLAEAAGADVLFCPGYSGPVFGATPVVVAIHDVSFAAHPEWFRWREGVRRRLVTRASARRAARVLTLTEFSKREIVEQLGVSPDRIEVVYPGVVRHPFAVGDATAESGADAALVLFVGSIFNRRHVPETIRGFERLARRRPRIGLTVVGDNRTFPFVDVERTVRDRARVRILRYVPDEVLGGLYRRARAFVFLSEYEGFGLTPLEALAMRVPIVVLDTPVAREVYGDAALYVTSPEPRLIEAALEAALFDDETRSGVLRKADSIVARYRWDRCARQVLDAVVAAARAGRSAGDTSTPP